MIIISLNSCTTARKANLYSGIAGSLMGSFVGSIVGQKMSPNKESDNANRILGGVVGAGVGFATGAYIGSYFFREDPENFKGEPINEIKNDFTKDEMIPLSQGEISLKDLNLLNQSVSTTKYIKSADVPDEIKDDVQSQVIIKGKIPKRVIHTKDGRTFIIKESEVVEHRYSGEY